MEIILDEEDAFTEAAAIVLTTIFMKYSSDTVRLSRRELDLFSIATNGNKFSDDEYDEMKTYFEMKEGGLTLNGFKEMYQLQTLADEKETRNDFATHGFKEYL